MAHLVTGGSGYLGSAIIKKLAEQNEQVISLDILETDEKIQNVRYIKGSVYDENLLDQILANIDYVHHNAALVPLTKSGNLFAKTNVFGTEIILKKSIEHNIKHFSHMSSSAVFGIQDADSPYTNLSRRNPVDTYGKSKKEGEDIVLAAMSAGIKTTFSIIRPRTILGPNRLGIFELLFKWIANGKDIFLIGNSEGLFQFAHLNDIVQASILSSQLCKQGVFNVGTLEFSSLKEDLKSLIDYSGKSSRIKILPEKLTRNTLIVMDKLRLSPFAEWHYLTYGKPYYFDSRYVFETLKYSPSGSNVDLLIEAYKSYINNNSSYKKEDSINKKSPHKSPLKTGIIDLAHFLASKVF